MRTQAWRWAVGALIIVALGVALGPQLTAARRTTRAAASPPAAGQLVIRTATEAPPPPAVVADAGVYDSYVRSVRELAGDTVEDRVDEDVLIRMGRRICFYLTKDGIDSTRDYVREYRTQRREWGFPVYDDLLVQGAAVAETAPATFCPEHVGAVSADEATRIVDRKRSDRTAQ